MSLRRVSDIFMPRYSYKMFDPWLTNINAWQFYDWVNLDKSCLDGLYSTHLHFFKRSPKRKRQQTPQPLRPPLAENQAETLPANLLDPGDHRRWRSLRRLIT